MAVKKRILFGVAAVAAVLAVTALVVPSLIDWSSLKEELSLKAKTATGRTLAINGKLKFAILPSPALVIEDVVLANAEGAFTPDMVRLKSLEVRIALGPLLGGHVQVETVRLVEPVIALEKLADGHANWEFTRPENIPEKAPAPPSASPGGKSGEDGASFLSSVRLDSFTIERGAVIYRDAVSGSQERIDIPSAGIAAVSLTGPFQGSGRLVARGLELAFDAAVGEMIHGRTVPLSLTFKSPSGDARIQVGGALTSLADEPKFKGSIKGGGKDLAAAIAAATGNESLPGFLSQEFALETAVVASAAEAEVKDLAVSLGDVRMTGGVSVALGEATAVTTRLAIARIDLDKWLALPSRSASSEPPVSGAKGKTSIAVAPPLKGSEKPAAGGGFSLPPSLTASSTLEIDSITWRGGAISQVRAAADLANGEITLSQLAAQLPGASEVAVFGFVTAARGQPRFEGEIEAKAADFRKILSWLGTDVPGLAADRLRKLALTGVIAADPEAIQLGNLDLRFDGSRLTGGVTLALRDRPAFGADLALDRISLDAYLPREGLPKEGRSAQAAAPQSVKPAKGGARPGEKGVAPAASDPFAGLGVLSGFDANLKAQVKSLTVHGITVGDASFDGTLYNGSLEVRRAAAGMAGGASAAVSGKLGGFTGQPKVENLRVVARAADLGPVLKQFQVTPPPAVAGLGEVVADLHLNGPLADPTITLGIKAAGGNAGFSGHAGLLPAPALTGTLTANHSDLRRLLRGVGGGYSPTGPLGGLEFSASLKADPGAVNLADLAARIGTTAIDGTAAVRLDGPRPRLAANLRMGEFTVDPFLPAERAAALEVIPASRLVPARPLEGHPLVQAIAARNGGADDARWSREPLDLSALRDFDADVKARAQAVIYQKYRIDQADLALALEGGVLDVSKLNGSVFGGGLDSQASVDAKGKPAVKTAVRLKGVDLGRALRTVAEKDLAGGTMDLTLDLASGGGSVAEMVSGLGGNGALSLTRIDTRAGAAGSALAPVLDLVGAINQLGGVLGGGKKGEGMADVSATFRIERGIARSEDFKMLSNLGEGRARGSVDLPRWLVDVDGEVRLSQNLLTQVLAAKTNVPQSLPFHLKGPLDKPNVTLETANLAGGGIAIPGLEKLTKKKGVGRILEQILPGQQPAQGASQDQPQGQPDPGQQSQPQAQPQAQPQVQPKNKAGNLLKDFLKGMGR